MPLCLSTPRRQCNSLRWALSLHCATPSQEQGAGSGPSSLIKPFLLHLEYSSIQALKEWECDVCGEIKAIIEWKQSRSLNTSPVNRIKMKL